MHQNKFNWAYGLCFMALGSLFIAEGTKPRNILTNMLLSMVGVVFLIAGLFTCLFSMSDVPLVPFFTRFHKILFGPEIKGYINSAIYENVLVFKTKYAQQYNEANGYYLQRARFLRLIQNKLILPIPIS
ncbi:MAG: hypothetical protein HWD59_11460 [Coxiellaceae bacterium]|nr:MAG: hypothetical protein HWD59_11460 [Coxiellaceae bacterium]